MTATIIKEEIEQFTLRVISAITPDCKNEFQSTPNGLITNPFSNTPILLVPESILRDLPVALEWTDRDKVAQENEELRSKVNLLIGQTWKDAQRGMKKESLRKVVLDNPELIDDLVRIYKRKGFLKYDFKDDKAGEYIWLIASKAATQNNPLPIAVSQNPTVDEVYEMVMKICLKFKELCENNGLCSLFYDKSNRIKHESAMQLLFYGIADSYCESNRIMIARECNSGRGPVDFKFGTNKENSILVEIKKSTNTSGLHKGITKQLPEYMNAEGAKRAIYLVIDFGFSKEAEKKMKSINLDTKDSAISIVFVDGAKKVSASKL